MARKRKDVCIHCLREQTVTMDHVLPKSWYPEDMPDDVNRWTAPSCKPCNQQLGKIERELKIRFGFCFPPDHHSAKGMHQASLRAIDQSKGKTGKDKKHRLRMQERIRAAMVQGSNELMDSCLTGFGPADGYPVESLIAIPIPVEMVDIVCEKMVRGLYYCLGPHAYIDSQIYEIKNHQLTY